MLEDGFCQCGCSKPTKLINVNNKRAGWIKGNYTRYVKGHNGNDGRLKGRVKGYKPTKESINKTRRANLGRKASDETKRKLSESHKGQIGWNKGLKMSDELRRKLSEAHKGLPSPKRGTKMSEEQRLKLRLAHKDKSLTSLQREKISRALKGRVKSEAHRKNMHVAQSKRSGKNHPWWKGGTTSINERDRKSFESKLWRTKVFERDTYVCQECQMKGGVLRAHHIKQWAYYPHLRFDVNNGITLCDNCHNNLHWPTKKLTKIDVDLDGEADYLECGIIGESLGLQWGGRFKDSEGKPNPDFPHLQWKTPR